VTPEPLIPEPLTPEPLTPDGIRELVRTRTSLRRPAAVPEVELHLVDDIVELWEHTGNDLPPPFWAIAWLGGQALARYLLDHREEVAGRRVLDLGCGSGLVAIAAQLAGAESVLAADVDPLCEIVVPVNAAANGVGVDVTVTDLLDRDPPDVDVILAGDVWYERELAGQVMSWLGRSGARVLLGDPGRAYLPQDGWTQLASYDIPTTRDLEGVSSKVVRVFSPAPR
jgi:predicted nicotinamide N-methyase